MGQKVHPTGIRLGISKPWVSTWYANTKDFSEQLFGDHKVRQYLTKELKSASVAKIVIERPAKSIRVTIHTARPGVVIGKKGTGIDALKLDVQAMTPNEVFINIQEVRKPDVDAQLVAENIAIQLEKRVSWRRALKKAIASAVRGGVRGVKVQVSGRLDGAEIARTEWYNEKSVPLHTLRADIDYGTAEAKTTYGIIGLKVWIYKGDVLSAKEVEEANRVKS